MKNLPVKLILITLTIALVITSCRNKEDATEPKVSDAEMQQAQTHSSDNQSVTANIDDAVDNINLDISAISTEARFETEPCGITVDYSRFTTRSGDNFKTIVYSFNSSANCSERTKEGKITVTLVSGNYFKDAGAVYTLAFQGYGVTHKGNKMTFDGLQTVTNVTGGLPRSIFTPGAIVACKVSGDMVLKFDSSALKRTWSMNRKISWSNTNGVLSYSISTNNVVDGLPKVSTWGTNRFGNSFYTQILLPVTANSTCGWYRPTGGERFHTVKDPNGSIIYSINSKINVGDSGCGNGFTITTTNKRGKVRSVTMSF